MQPWCWTILSFPQTNWLSALPHQPLAPVSILLHASQGPEKDLGRRWKSGISGQLDCNPSSFFVTPSPKNLLSEAEISFVRQGKFMKSESNSTEAAREYVALLVTD